MCLIFGKIYCEGISDLVIIEHTGALQKNVQGRRVRLNIPFVTAFVYIFFISQNNKQWWLYFTVTILHEISTSSVRMQKNDQGCRKYIKYFIPNVQHISFDENKQWWSYFTDTFSHEISKFDDALYNEFTPSLKNSPYLNCK